MSSLLYLATNTLCKFFHKDRQANKLIGLGPPYLEGKTTTNYHYVDDPILFLKATYENVAPAWWG